MAIRQPPLATYFGKRDLAAYRGKRDFARTPEPGPARTKHPAPAPAKRPAPAGAKRPAPAGAKSTEHDLIFVVQKHAASHLHWDFRLEHDGVLWSWAVPKGPSMDTAHKRLAVHVEDHPLDYAGFEGVIPKGNYGAGTVEIWDRGTWSPLGNAAHGLAQGELKFILHGQRLHGNFVLVRLKPRPGERGESWLLIKEHDGEEAPGEDAEALEAVKLAGPRAKTAKPAKQAGWQPPERAKPGRLPETPAPMLASNAEAPPTGQGWLSEIKFDGYRLIVRKQGDQVRLLTRNGLDWTQRLAPIAQAVADLPAEDLLAEDLLADSELVFLQKDGLSSFPDLQAALAELVPEAGLIRLSSHLEGITERVRQTACAVGLEGNICKPEDAPYRAGRSRDWLKLKCQGREEFLVLGWTPPQGARTGLGALHLGFYDEPGALHYAGGCGSGFTEATLRELSAKLTKLAADAPAGLRLTPEKPPGNLHRVRPELVAEVQYTAWCGAGRLRHPVFLGRREDKAPAEIVRQIPNPQIARVTSNKATATHSGCVVGAGKPATRNGGAASGVRLTHPERELWPAADGHKPVTKQDLANYWQIVAKAALPGIANRPLAFVRCPDGMDGQHFFQKHANRGMPTQLEEGECDGAPYLALRDTEGLIATAQISALELHSWGSDLNDPAHPDRLVFDLDPGENVTWEAIVAAAKDVRARLEKKGMPSFCRTSGGRGLHVVAPLVPSAGWDTARAWSRAFAEAMEREQPTLYVASVPKARRRGRILVDWLRNGLGSTAIASFSPRARPHATVAMPITWRELTVKLDPQTFTVHSVPGRIARSKCDPWEGFGDAVSLPE